MGLESDKRDIIFTFVLQTDPTNGNFCASNIPQMETFVPQTDTYVRVTESVYITFNDSVDSHIVSHLWDPFVGLRFFLNGQFLPIGNWESTVHNFVKYFGLIF